jgi:hypothetical protein
VKESVAEKFFVRDRIFLAGDACHIHSVNGGQGLNTGLADAFNLMWKLKRVIDGSASAELLQTYEDERKPVALSVIEASAELVRSTKYSETGTHAQDYVKIVQKRAGNITGMGIRYGEAGLRGSRVHDFVVSDGVAQNRLYALLRYTHFTLLIFSERKVVVKLPDWVKLIHIHPKKINDGFWAESSPYREQAVLVRPDSYIDSVISLEELATYFKELPL